MKMLPILLMCALASVSASAEEVTYQLEAHVTNVFSFGGTTDAQAQFHTGDTITILLSYETDTPASFVGPFDAIYDGALIEASVEYSNGFAFLAHGAPMKVTDEYPSWDAISWEAQDQGGNDQIDSAPIGDARLVAASSSLTDTGKTALSSKALIPLPPFSSFSGSFFNLAFVPADGSGGRVTHVHGRISSLVIAQMSPDTAPQLVSAGGWHTCRIRESGGNVACWGWNDYGQSNPPPGTFKSVGSGKLHSCAMQADGTVVCWGDDTYGQASPPLGTFSSLSAGQVHNCGVRPDGTLTCWGFNGYFAADPPAGAFRAVSATGDYSSCGLRSNGTLACWGWDGHGQATPPTGTFKNVSAGTFHSCGVRTDSTVVCWGEDVLGSAGAVGGQTSPPSGSFSSVSVGRYHSCGLHSDGTVVCWGENNYGQSTPASGAFVAISSGQYHSCGLRADGALACWGFDYLGQAPKLDVRPLTLPSLTTGSAYNLSLSLMDTAVGASAEYPYTSQRPEFALLSGAVPPGMNLTAAGLLSGTPTGTGSFNFTVAGQDANGFAALRSYALTIDAPSDGTAPAISPSLSGPFGQNGWHIGDVTIIWSVSDTESAVTSATGCNSTVLTTDALGASFTCTATSAGGTASNSVTVKRDATAPVLAPVVTPAVILFNGSGSVAANASDTLSGVATQACVALNTATVGSHTSTCTATDAAGNSATATASYSVIYGFVGFGPPVENAPVVNLANAGRTIPFKWRLVDANGTPITNLIGVTLLAVSISCNGTAGADAVEEYALASTGFINHGNGDYQYNWQSPKGYENSCKKVVIDLGDGSTRMALFQFH